MTAFPLTVQMPGVVELKITGSPMGSVAATDGDVLPIVSPTSVPLAPTANDEGYVKKSIVWGHSIRILTETGLAARYWALPARLAVTTHVMPILPKPTAGPVTVLPASVQGPLLSLKDTGRPELAVATSVKLSVSPNIAGYWVKVMVWVAPMGTVCVA